MKFDVYFPFHNKAGVVCPGTNAYPMDWNGIIGVLNRSDVKQTVAEVRAGNKEKKKYLPAIDWIGRTTNGKRLAEKCVPTGFIMADIDHCKDCDAAFQEIRSKMEEKPEVNGCMLIIHRTPSLGLRLVFKAIMDFPTVSEHMEWLRDELELDKYGDYDTKVKDLSRISFVTTMEDVLYLNTSMMLADDIKVEDQPIKVYVTESLEKAKDQPIFPVESESEVFTEDEKRSFAEINFRGTPIPVIVEKYVEVNGEPSSGEIHNYYNEMVKYFRCITSNNKRALLYFLPRFGHTYQECWSQIVSICRVNTLSRLEKPFYFFLKDNGFYTQRGERNDSLKEYMLSDEEEEVDKPPYLPPVFRELVGSAPKDFVLPAINSLLPILGTLTSYLKAVYPYDNREHTTSFFSVIYAPPGTGKGFVERFLDLLFEDIKIRDFVQSERENVYLRVLQKKGANDKSPDMPHTSLRLIPPKNSEAEFLQKQRDNHGYHMFTYAAEMDSWAKGVRAAGGNKDDMIRIAWDNGEYGQQFKSANTFKGQVRLYWNVLITGTIAQVESYFKNVENGLVTRCSFTSIDNQEFAEAPVWKSITKKGMDVIHNFMKRCDERTYYEPCTVNILDLETVNDDDFDKEIDWKFKFRERREVDLSWIMPTIEKFHKEQTQLAAKDIDRARDVFRRRVGVRGFRLALICVGLWENPRQSDLEKCKSFIWWWMHKDIDCMLKLWGKRYNEQTDVSPVIVQRSVFDQLDDCFTKNDVYVTCMKQGIKTPVRRIIFDWKKLGYIEQKDKEHFKKKKI